MRNEPQIITDAGEAGVADGVVCEGRATTAGGRNWKVSVQTLHRGGRSEGVRIVAVDNGAMSISVLPTRGMGIWQVLRHHSPSSYRAGEGGAARLGWRSPVHGPVHPAFVPVFDPSGLGWLEGFDELLCRCGLESNGAPDFDDSGKLLYPLHGRIANLPAGRVEVDVDEKARRISLRGIIDETRFHFQSLRLTTTLTTTIGSNEFTWTDEVRNIGGRDATMQMLYHFNIGQPLLQPGAQIVAPVATVAPHTAVAANEGVEQWNVMPPPRPGAAEQVYLLDLLADDSGDTRVLVSGLVDDEAISLRFNKRALPCFTVWRNTPAETDGYVVGIEPGTNYPNPRSFEEQRRRIVSLKSGESWRAEVTATWHTEQQSISREADAIRAIQGEFKTDSFQRPRAEWSAIAE